MKRGFYLYINCNMAWRVFSNAELIVQIHIKKAETFAFVNLRKSNHKIKILPLKNTLKLYFQFLFLLTHCHRATGGKYHRHVICM